jgi:DUF177 domain-containing protein
MSLVFDISEFVGRPGASRVVAGSERVEGLRGALGWVEEGDPVELDLRLDSLIEGIGVSGKLGALMQMECCRCLVRFEAPVTQDVDEVFWFEARKDGEDYQVEGKVVDLEPMVRDAIVLAIPVHPLHVEACKGLCAVCGGDLNEKDCGHRPSEVDSRWAPLRELLGEEAG